MVLKDFKIIERLICMQLVVAFAMIVFYTIIAIKDKD